MFKGFIFDFDGTLVRSHEQVFAVLEELAKDYDLNLPAAEHLRNLSTMEAIQTLGLRLWQVPRFTVLARRKLKARLDSVGFEPGALDLLHELRNHKELRVGLVSSNSAENISYLLGKFGAAGLFDEILCGSSLLGKSRSIAKMIKKLSLKHSDCLYIGDETRDIEACRKISVKVAAVGWGFHSGEKLRSFKPDYFAETVQDLRGCVIGPITL